MQTRTVGQYQVVTELGRGQHSIVYKAWQPSLGRWVALKVLHHSNERTLQRFRAEARLTANLVQQGVPNIRRLYEVDQTADGSVFVALELIEDSLQSLLRRARDRGQPVGAASAARLLKPIAKALDALHSLGWVHLDIKPQNILISRDGRALLADFGIAQRIGAKTHACTPLYASPEQAAGDRPVGPWSDIYSLGVVLYEMLTERLPVQGEQDLVLLHQHLEANPPAPRSLNPRLSARQERALLTALAKSPERRPHSASALVQELLPPGASISGVLQTSDLLRTTEAAPPKRASTRNLLIGGALLALALLALLGWALWPRSSPDLPGEKTTAPATAAATATPTSTPSLRRPEPIMTPTAVQAPTSTLAPTSTRAMRPPAKTATIPAPPADKALPPPPGPTP